LRRLNPRRLVFILDLKPEEVDLNQGDNLDQNGLKVNGFQIETLIDSCFTLTGLSGKNLGSL